MCKYRDIILSDNSHYSLLRPFRRAAGSAAMPLFQFAVLVQTTVAINIRFLTSIFIEGAEYVYHRLADSRHMS